MKRVLFIISHIVLSCIWTFCNALCVKPVSQVMLQQEESFSGILTMIELPCPSNEDPENPCLPCLTLAFVSNNTLYYLTSDNDSILNELNMLENLWTQDTMVFITGIPYKEDSIHYINVKEIKFGSEPSGFNYPSSDFPSVSKFLHDGHLLIERGNKRYNAQGKEIK